MCLKIFCSASSPRMVSLLINLSSENKFSQWWPELIRSALYPPESEVLPLLIENIFSSLSLQGKTLLDAGFGEGRFARLARELGAVVEGCDIDRGLVELVAGEFDTIECSLTSLTWSDEVFDIVLCSDVLMYIDDVNLAISELARVLVPGGKCIVGMVHPCFSDWAPDRPAPVDAARHYPLHEERYWIFELDKGRKIRVKQYHRPLHFYLNLLSRFFILDQVFERGALNLEDHADREKYNPVEYIFFQLSRR